MRWQLPDNKVSGSIVDFLLESRGVNNEQRATFLNPKWEHIHDYTLLNDTKKAADAVISAIGEGKKIFIHGDFDVDGVCATAIVWDFLYRSLGADVTPYIPSRFDEGYGLSPASLDAILEQGGELVITVDCGVKNIAEIEEYTQKGLKFIVTDHHTLPVDGKGNPFVSKEALAVVHPRHPDGSYPFPDISGTTVAWKLVQAISAAAGLDPQLIDYLDLVAMATVCDVMPLVGENRAIVALGLNQMRNTERAGLKALYQVAAVNPEEIASYHPGFVLGPRLNAAGRLDTAMTSLRLLSTQSFDQALVLAANLDSLNSERQEVTRKLMQEAGAQIAKLDQDQRLFFIHGDKWPEGVVGLVAGKLTEKYHRPVLVGSSDGEFIKGSARSTEHFHVANAFKELDSFLERHGGHAQAAGFTIKADNVDDFTASIVELAAKDITPEQLEKVLRVDALVDPDELTVEQITDISQLEPFGFGNTKPVFAMKQVEVTNKFLMGSEKQHLKLRVGGVDLLAFNAPDHWLSIDIGDAIDVAGTLGINEWKGRKSMQLIIRDIKQG